MGGVRSRLLRAVAIDEILALKRHPILNRDTAAECFDAFDVAIRDRLAMVEEPMKTVEWDLAIHLFIHIQGARDGLLIGRVQAERPAILDELANHLLQFLFHRLRHFRARFEKILEIRRRVDQHLAPTIHPIEVIASAGLSHPCPRPEVAQFLLWASA